ncbi:MAG: HD domain-containing protein [Clostridia bacterium]|nr:HD domain-containing protein [Clostridia bacterium]
MSEEKKRSASRPAAKIARLILVYMLFIFINIAINRLVVKAGWPLYVDSIGTLLGAVLGGYLPGIFVGYLTNIINATASIENLYYAGISVLIAVSATFLAHRGFYDKFWKALLTVPFLAFCGGGIGSLLTICISGAESGVFHQIGYDYVMDLLDKAITVTGFYLIKLIMPKSVTKLLALTDWQQTPLTKEQLKKAQKATTRSWPLRIKLGVLICAVMIAGAVATTAISYHLYRQFSIQQYTTIGRNSAELVAKSIDGDMVNKYLEDKDTTLNGYKPAERDLYEIRNNADYSEYVYVYQIREDGCHVVFDLDTPDTPAAELGEVIPFDESFQEVLPKLLAGERIDPIVTDDTYGWLLSDYEPIYDSEGNCVAYACVDISMRDIELNGLSFLAKILSLFIGFFILILVLFIWYTEYHLTYPLDAMTFAASEFAYNSDESLDISVERMKLIDVKTGDEIENLYNVLVKTLSDTVDHLEDVEKKGAQIEKMQSGLIYILADMVESRDKCTGDHVRKTAAYVELIMQLMKENNIYADELTDEFMRDVYSSAPLHDVGKIKVSDIILNKPGKLTDEEFAEMKSHTTAGKDIIERAIELSGESGYLSEALNLATYHHEKWDGSGYPTGLKGEEIPLSARIMAVSDVFDALLSIRSYKQPFSFEKAMSIIEEGIGTHFDTQIAKVFVDNQERVYKVASDNRKNIEKSDLEV